MRVSDPHCRGRGDREERRYPRLACVAGARRPGERFDTVAVLYEVRPTGACCSSYRLARVRFIGGPGIP